jgi:hypothetical protein
MVSSVGVPEGFVIEDDTTIGKVSAALLKCNSHILSGDQFTIIHLEQRITPEGIPQVVMKLHEFILDKSSAVLFYTKIPQSLFFVTGNHIGTDANAKAGGMAYILSRRVGNKLHVSPQSIVLTPGYTLYQTYSSEEQKKKAMESYGNVDAYYLDPADKTNEDDDPQDPEDPYFAVTGVALNGTSVAQGSGVLNIATGDVLVISGAKLTDVGLKVNILTNPLGSPTTADLSGIGSVVATEEVITLTVATGGKVYHLLRADDNVIVYDFGN